eukprot:3583938-Prymnesium_polylepis.2
MRRSTQHTGWVSETGGVSLSSSLPSPLHFSQPPRMSRAGCRRGAAPWHRPAPPRSLPARPPAPPASRTPHAWHLATARARPRPPT